MAVPYQILNRSEFAEYFNCIKQGLGSENSLLWVPEARFAKTFNWFIQVPNHITYEQLDDHYKWCQITLKGLIACFVSNEKCDWWGFEHKEDIMIWVLKWS